jgi:hypothetical protein
MMDDVSTLPDNEEEHNEEPVPEWAEFTEFPDVYTAWKTTNHSHHGDCDRRLSRAARNVLRKHLVRTFFRHSEATEQDDIHRPVDHGKEDSLPDLLNRWMRSSGTGPSHQQQNQSAAAAASCPLLWPSLDVFQQDEEATRGVYIQSLPGGPRKNLKIAYPNYVLKQRGHAADTGSKDDPPPERWFQCEHCGKTFSTQFYLDLHMNRHHSRVGVEQGGANGSYNKQNTICPATDWCNLVGMANCHTEALKSEPYYDRGNNGWGGDAGAMLVQHKWAKIAHAIPCDEAELQQHCRSVMVSCGLLVEHKAVETDNDDWAPPFTTDKSLANLFCQTLACPRKQNLWQYLDEEVHDVLLTSFHSNTNNNPFVASFQDHWRDIWAKESHHHHHLLTWIGGLVLVGLVMWVLRMVMLNSTQNKPLLRTRPIPAGKRLLSKKGRLTFQGRGISRDRIKRD